MRASLNEIEMTVMKAARGAGMEWGLAEEAAQCARWLALFDLPWQRAIVAVLHAGDWHAEIARDKEAIRPVSPNDWLCPIKAGAYLSDLGGDGPDLIERVRCPVLLLPFAARLAGLLRLSWKATWIWLDSGAPAVGGDLADLELPQVDQVAIKEAACLDRPILPKRSDPAVDIDSWRELKLLESRTYVPASLRSRIGGAGPTAGDND
jgi:hypothetical protein